MLLTAESSLQPWEVDFVWRIADVFYSLLIIILTMSLCYLSEFLYLTGFKGAENGICKRSLWEILLLCHENRLLFIVGYIGLYVKWNQSLKLTEMKY